MLINFTNHPAARWSEAQRMAARQYGAVVDLPFPEVDPAASETSRRQSVEQPQPDCTTLKRSVFAFTRFRRYDTP